MNKSVDKIKSLQEQIKDAPEWKKRQLESKLAMFVRKVAPHKFWSGGTYRKGKEEIKQ